MDRDQRTKSSKKAMHEGEQGRKKIPSSSSGLKQMSSESSLLKGFDSGADVGYKSGDLDSAKSISSSTQSHTIKKEHSMRFDSGLGSDVFSPLTSASDIPSQLEEESDDKTAVAEQKQPDIRLLWCNIYSRDKDGDTILHLAVCEARSDIIFPLIRQAPHPDLLDICNDLCQTALHLSVLTGKSNIVRRLVAAGATLDIQDHHGNTALHIAARNGDLDCVHALLEPLTQEEVDDAQCLYDVYPQTYNLSYLLNQKNYEGQTSIHLAAIGGFRKVLECLYDHGADVNDKEGKSGKTALHYAVEYTNYEVVQILVSKCHANITAKNYAGQTPIHVAWTLCRRSKQRLPRSIFEFLRKNIVDPWECPSSSDSSSDEDNAYEATHAPSRNK